MGGRRATPREGPAEGTAGQGTLPGAPTGRLGRLVTWRETRESFDQQNYSFSSPDQASAALLTIVQDRETAAFR